MTWVLVAFVNPGCCSGAERGIWFSGAAGRFQRLTPQRPQHGQPPQVEPERHDDDGSNQQAEAPQTRRNGLGHGRVGMPGLIVSQCC